MKRFFVLLVIAVCIAACGSAQAPVATPRPTPAPTLPTSLPVNPTSIQEGAQGYSHGTVKSGINAGIVWVTDDIDQWDMFGATEEIKFDCFDIQQELWYGLKSTINADGSTTIIKSQFREVGITILHKGRGVAACRLTSKTADKIDKAGMWDDGDFDGAWTMYDSASIEV